MIDSSATVMDDNRALNGTILFELDENSINNLHKKQTAKKIAVLQVISRSGRDGNQYPLSDGSTCMIGSGEDCHVRFLLENVDTQHARLVVADGKITLKNLSAGEYTYINDVRMLFDEIRTIHFGDIVTISGRHMRIDAPIREPNARRQTMTRRTMSTPTTPDRTQNTAAFIPPSLLKWSSNRANNPLHSSTPNPFASQPRMSSWLAGSSSRKSRALINFDDTTASTEDMFATTEPSPAIVRERHLLDATISPNRIKPSFFGGSIQQSAKKQQHQQNDEKSILQIATEDMDVPVQRAEIEPLIDKSTANVISDATTANAPAKDVETEPQLKESTVTNGAMDAAAANTDDMQSAPEQDATIETFIDESTANETVDVTTANTDEMQIVNEGNKAPEQDVETEPPMEELTTIVTMDATVANTDEKPLLEESTANVIGDATTANAPEKDVETEPPLKALKESTVTNDAVEAAATNTDEMQIVNEDTNAPEKDVETEPPVDESTVNDTTDVTTTNMDEKPKRSQRRNYVRPASAEPTSACDRVLRSHTKKATDFANQTTDKVVQKSKPKRGLVQAPPVEQTDPAVVTKRSLRSSRKK